MFLKTRVVNELYVRVPHEKNITILTNQLTYTIPRFVQ